jgi:HAMP domain-containing protein
MSRSIFRRLIVIFISVLILAFILAGIMLYYFLGNYVSRDKIDTLTQSGEAIQSYLSFYVENEGSPLSSLIFSRILKLHSSDTGSLIFVTNKEGYVIYSGPELRSLNENIIKNFHSESGGFRLPDIKQHEKALSEQTATVAIGDLGGLFRDTGYSWLTVRQPFLFRIDRYPDDISGVIYLNMPVPEIQRMRYLIFRFFIVSVAASALVSVIPVYIFSLRLSKPLKEINRAAKLIAGGEFNKRLAIESKDEIGELATASSKKFDISFL